MKYNVKLFHGSSSILIIWRDGKGVFHSFCSQPAQMSVYLSCKKLFIMLIWLQYEINSSSEFILQEPCGLLGSPFIITAYSVDYHIDSSKSFSLSYINSFLYFFLWSELSLNLYFRDYYLHFFSKIFLFFFFFFLKYFSFFCFFFLFFPIWEYFSGFPFTSQALNLDFL